MKRIQASYSSLKTNSRPEIASMYKIGVHSDRIKSYLSGEKIFPVTLELDLTSQCNRTCSDCPSTRAARSHHLSRNFIQNLFSSLAGETRGLLLTGGEPTLSPLFSDALRMADQSSFENIAVVTNGSFLDAPRVADSLLNYATTIRLSIYDWENNACHFFESTLKKIEFLRQKIDQSGSKLQIGISALTSENHCEKLKNLVERVRSSGAHWIYFHPLCHKWQAGIPTPEKQSGVAETIRELQQKPGWGNMVFLARERYDDFPLQFKHYHAAFFLLVVGADGIHYLGPEVKYNPHFAINNLADFRNEQFLWETQRINFIRSLRSQTYPALKSRHRGVLYNHFIDFLQKEKISFSEELEKVSSMDFYFPYIL